MAADAAHGKNKKLSGTLNYRHIIITAAAGEDRCPTHSRPAVSRSLSPGGIP
jgi:hypothetical protein